MQPLPQPYFDKTFELRYFEMNRFGEASLTTVLTLLEETAAEHCHAIGYGMYELEKMNLGWVLLSGAIEMKRYPKYKEKIRIRTWLSEYSLIKGFRENLIFGENDELIGSARGFWLFFDIARRRPSPILDEIRTSWGCLTDKSVEIDISKKQPPIQTTPSKIDFNVRKLDIDGNNHVSNIRYLHWVLESVPEQIVDNYYIKSIDGRFISEVKYGETVQVHIQEDEAPLSFNHTIRSNDQNRVCATAKTIWAPYP